jgi:hypothetical protein
MFLLWNQKQADPTRTAPAMSRLGIWLQMATAHLGLKLGDPHLHRAWRAIGPQMIRQGH